MTRDTLHYSPMVVVQLISSLLFLFSLLPSINAAALTTQLAANERLCFYADVDKVGEKIGVSLPYPSGTLYQHPPP